MRYLIILLVYFFAGCATIASGDPARDRQTADSLLRASGVADDVTLNFWTLQRKIMADDETFSLDDKQVVWWGALQNCTGIPVKLSIEWIDPEGNTYKAYSFMANNGIDGIISTVLKIDKPKMSNLQGRWSAVVSFGGELVDSQQFYIGTMSEIAQVSKDDLIKDFPEISDEDAAVLLRESVINVDKNFKIRKSLRQRVKILNEQGKTTFSNISIPFYSSMENVQVKMAQTIDPKGTVHKSEHFKMSSPFESYPSYNTSRIMSFAMPGLEVGSLIEYDIGIESYFMQMLPSFQEEFIVGGISPVVSSRLKIVCPGYFNLNYKSNIDDISYTVEEGKGGNKEHVWTANNISAIKPESAMVLNRDTLPSVVVYTSLTAKELADWWRSLSEESMFIDAKIDKALQDIKNNTGDAEQGLLKDISSYVKSNIEYVQVPLGASLYQPNKVSDTFKDRYGDCKDQAALLLTMLKKAGISDVGFGLVRNRENGDINMDSMNPREFNHVVVVAGKDFIIDPTDKNNKFGETPISAQGTKVFVIKDDEQYFIDVPLVPAEKNVVEKHVKLDISEDLKVTGSMEVAYKGYEEQVLRELLTAWNDNQESEYVTLLIRNLYPGATVDGFDIENKDDTSKNIKLSIKFSLQQWLEDVGDDILLRFMNVDGLSVPAYLSAERKFPVYSAYLRSLKSTIDVNLPKSLRIKNIPKDFHLEQDSISGSVAYKRKGNSIICEQEAIYSDAYISLDELNSYRSAYEKLFFAHKKGVLLKKGGSLF